MDALIELADGRLDDAAVMLRAAKAGSMPVLNPDLVKVHRSSWSVARIGGKPVGFATGIPMQLPGKQGLHDTVATLNFLVVDEAHSGKGIGARLIQHVSARRRTRGARLMIAHIPAAARTLYEREGWTVLEPELGLAWQLENDMFLADYANSGAPYVHFAYKAFEPFAYSFEFEHHDGPPVGVATRELVRRVKAGEIDGNRLSSDAVDQIRVAAASGMFR